MKEGAASGNRPDLSTVKEQNGEDMRGWKKDRDI
jgi:hypothetical protein